MTILHVLPLAAGAAVSPALLGASLEILHAFPRTRVRMLLAYLAGAAAVVTAVLLLSAVLPQRPSAQTARIEDVVDLVLGGILLALAVALAVRRPRTSRPERPQSAGTESTASGWRRTLAAFASGIVMMVTNVSTLTLVLAGAHEAGSGTAPAVRIAAFVLLALGAVLPIVLPLLWVVVDPAGATRRLEALDAVLQRHSRVIGIVVCLATAAYLIARGLGLL